MTKHLEVFLPKNQNMIQKIGYVTALLFSIIIVFLHNPFDGYSRITDTTFDTQGCRNKLYVEYGLNTPNGELIPNIPDNKFIRKMEKIDGACSEPLLPMSEWTSVAPIIYWFGSVLHTIATVFCTLLMGLICIIVFKEHPTP